METGTTTGPGAAVGVPRSSLGPLPNVIVIGAQKCGTSGLHYYFGLHPQVSVSEPKELNFFIAERNWSRGIDWYRGCFDPAAPVRVDASPNYTAHPHFAGVPERMAEVVPDARLIFMVRDPVDRIAAHWVHNYSKGRHTGEIERTILNPNATYVSRSRYAMQLERFLPHYPLERILVLEQADLRAHRDATLRQVFEFAGADPSFTDRRFSDERHKTNRKTRPTRLGARLDARRERSDRHVIAPHLWAAARTYWPLGRRIERPAIREAIPDDVIELLRADATRLGELTGRSFDHWSSLWGS